jgi:hypothetical protein
MEDEIMLKTILEEVKEKRVTKTLKVIEKPRISLKQIAVYPFATQNAKERIILTNKYPGGYVNRCYEEARKLICDLLSANFEEHEYYFDEFKKQAESLKKQALLLEKGQKKNKESSAFALEAFINIADKIKPILNNYTFNSNLANKKDHLRIYGVHVGAVADALLYINGGATIAGFIKFSFTKKKLKKEEAENILYILKTFIDNKFGKTMQTRDCILIDVVAGRIYKAATNDKIEILIFQSCKDIVDKWDLL